MEGWKKKALSEQVGEAFSIRLGPDESLVLELMEVSGLDGSAPRPFSLQLRGPGDGYLKQGMYELENDALGKAALFMAPLGPDETREHMLYEIVFN